jgi:sortase (surface protein transpeptidase)
MDGHLDWYSGPAVFANLGRLHAADRLSVTYTNGDAALFRVRSTATYAADLRPPAQLFRTDGPPQLVLITCAGPWDRTRYRERLIVVATPDRINLSQN